MTTKTLVQGKITYSAIHNWPKADSIPEVAFLKHPHHHVFYISFCKEVTHDDREVEYIQLGRQIEAFLAKYRHDFGPKSCEMIAREILEEFDLSGVEVLEDNIGGASILKV